MLQIGIVGLPNVGKSSLFKALTKKQVDISNYPFTTIDPNVGIVAVPDERVDSLAQKFQSKKVIPTIIEFVDIAGLVKGAAVGEGLGNKFLANIREVDAIAHVVRVFEDERITHIHKIIDPLSDIEIIETELALADMETKEKRAGKENKEKDLPPLQLLANKKIIYVFNASEEQIKNNWRPTDKLLEKIGKNEYVVLSCKFELMLSESNKEEAEIYLSELGLKKPGLEDLIQESYHLLDLLTFFTTGEDETRAWTTKINALIPQAVRVIHTDFEKNFIKAEVINWKELLEVGSWSGARQAGKLKLVGRDYVIQEGDVVEVKI